MKDNKNKTQSLYVVFLSFLLIISLGYGQSKNQPDQGKKESGDLFELIQIKTDTLFNSKQSITLLIFPKTSFKTVHFDFAYSDSNLRTTSSFGKSHKAIAAINGSFFDVEKGGSVTYFEINDTVVSRTRNADLKWAKPDSLINAAIVISKDSEIRIEKASPDSVYERSNQESAVLISGPLLLLNSKKVKLPDMKFSSKRHPRTSLGISRESLIFVTIDGRSKQAKGMSLSELQTFLQSIGCIDAINLDGGGSTAMWVMDKGIVNTPSDRSGERPVSNALVITEKNTP